MVGASGVGKSTLLAQMIVQDIEKGYSVIVLDPHKDLIRLVYKLLIQRGFAHWERVIPWEPGSFSHGRVHTWNVIEMKEDLTPTEAAQCFTRLCQRIWAEVSEATSGMPLFSQLSSNVLTLAAANGGTIFDAHRILTDRSLREKIYQSLANPAIANWFHQYFDPLMSRTGRMRAESLHRIAGSFIRRINAFETSEALQTLLGCKTSTLDFSRMARGGKVLLCDFSRLTETDVLRFLMTMVVQEVKRVIFAREEEEERSPCALYIDEVNLVLENLGSAAIVEDLISQSRKFNLMICFAHAGMTQLRDPALRGVLLRVPTQICFRQNSREDALTMAQEMFKLDLEKAIRHPAKREDQFDKEWYVQELWEQHTRPIGELRDREALLKAPLPKPSPLLSLLNGRSQEGTRRFRVERLDVEEASDSEVEERIRDGLERYGLAIEKVRRALDAHYVSRRREVKEEEV